MAVAMTNSAGIHRRRADRRRFVNRVALVALCTVLLPIAAAAQPVPDTGQVAVGAEFGIFLPTDDRLATGLVAGGLFEVYAAPRLGIRGSVTSIRSGYDREDDDDERQI